MTRDTSMKPAANRKSPSIMEAPSQSPEEDPSRTRLLANVRGWLKPLFGKNDASLKEVVEEAIEEHEEQAETPLPVEEKQILQNVLAVGDITVGDIMTQRSDITAIRIDIPLGELKDHITRHRHTRIPVYRDTPDQMVGFLHVKDLLPMLCGDMGFEINALMRDLLFVPGSMRILDLLVKMRQSGILMAIVVDEHGVTDGLVTLEDLFEEIIGDIQDEHDGNDEEHMISRVAENVYEVKARVPIEKLEAHLGRPLALTEEGEFHTLGGLVFFLLGRVPAKGEKLEHAGMMFEIIEADARRIHKVRIRL